MIEDLNDLKVKVEKHGEEISTLKSDMRAIGSTVTQLVSKVDTLTTDLRNLDLTVRDATVALKTLVHLGKILVGGIALAGSILGIYLALNH
jgi:hypothetical protein